MTEMTFIISSLLQNHSFFKWIGATVCCVKLLKFSCLLIKKVYNRIRGLEFEWNDLGKWAVVTGGTDGIGKAYAEQLAEKGFSICIISRNSEKLKAVAESIESKHEVSVKTVHVDFTDGPEIYDEIRSHLQELEGGIGVLVNNVGMSYKNAEYFHLIPDGLKVLTNLINSNVTSCTMMMRLVMPDMKKRGKGVIINVSSLLAIYPTPMLTVYAACKAYVDYLSRATQYEYKDEGIIIQSLLPGYVATKMSNRRTRLEVPSADKFVSSAIKTVGLEDCTYGYFPHKIRGFVHEWLKANMPACVNLAIAMHFMNKSRESYYRKLQKRRQISVQ